MRVAFAGTPEFALPALAALSARHTLVGVLTQPDRPRGRGRQLAPSAVKSAAEALGVPVAQPDTLKDESARATLGAWAPEVLVVVAYGLLLPREILALPRFGCLNIHASLLPRWRGAAPVQRAILAGDAETGVSIMQMEAGLDTGAVFLEHRRPIGARDTAAVLLKELAGLGASALIEVLEALPRGLAPTPQPESGATYAPKIGKAEALIDWHQGVEAIDRRIRAFNPWPVAETRLNGEALRVLEAIPQQSASNMLLKVDRSPDPGSIVSVRGDSILVQCGTGVLGLTRLQRPGRRPVSARDFAHGQPLEGVRLG